MAVRRMFSREICETDTFLDLPATAQRLYFFLGLQADDEGFLQNANSVIRLVGSSRDDMNVLTAKRFVIPFDSGVVVIRHWRQHNYVPKDRFHSTRCLEEKKLLSIDSTNTYELSSSPVYMLDTGCIQVVDNPYTEGREGEGRLDKDNSSVVASAPPAKKTKRFVPPTIEEVTAYCQEIGSSVDPQYFINYYESIGWKVGRSPMKSWRATLKNWTRKETSRQSARSTAPAARGFTPIPTAEEYAEGLDASGFGWA